MVSSDTLWSFYAELDLPLQMKPEVYEVEKTLLKNHYPKPKEIKTKLQEAKVNHALVIGESEYAKKGDSSINLPRARRDALGMNRFLKKSKLKF